MRIVSLLLFIIIVFSNVEAQSEDLPAIPPEIEQASNEWPLANRDYANTRAVLDAEISSETVDMLDVAWTFDIPGIGAWGAAATTPLIANGVVYFQDLQSNVFALDFETGEIIWEQMYERGVLGPNGPGIGYGRVFISSNIDHFAALDINTGEELWSVSTDGRPTGAFQPYAFGGHVYLTTQAGVAGEGEQNYVGYRGGTSGHIYALNPENGETVWEFQTVEEGFWGNPELNSGGGVWYPPGIDVETGVTYWGTGNPAPFAGTVDYPNASSRPGDNLYTNSMLALDGQSGELLWYNQVKPHDLFDLDFHISPILTTVDIDGEARNIAIGSGKLGRVVVIDRETGETIWDRPVGIHQNDERQEIPADEPTIVYPGQLGGVENPMALADDTVYAVAVNLGTPHTATGWDAETGPESVPRSEGRMHQREGTSDVVAIDTITGEILWETALSTASFSGTTVVNDLVFVATLDGIIYALSRENGEIVWEYAAPGGINGLPAVTEDTILFPIGIGSNPVLLALRLTDQQGTPTPEESEG
ncbi:MAG: PQQ-binding-like beta-propeller repeat protein [Aggregatilineales bacterium]